MKEMKKFSLLFLMCVICATDLFAAVPGATRTISVKNKNIEPETVTQKNRASRDNASRENASHDRNTSRSATDTARTKTASRAAQNSSTVSRVAQRNNMRAADDKNVTVVSRVMRDDSNVPGNVVHRAKVASRPSVGRQQSGTESDARNIQERAVTLGTKKQTVPTAESIATAKDVLEKTADLNSTCQQQYNDCMDQFCMVVDANQKRCSCSENLAKYAAVQQAVEDANAELNDVAQNIRYLGLSADEIRAIMNATEAELELSKNKDTSQTRSMLDDIADMIKDPTSSKSMSYLSDTNSLLDMEFDFDSDSSDLFGLDLFMSTTDISSKRGKDLYREATKRCKTVLNQCKDAGATEAQISGNYDLAISKDCAAYEQGLTNLNQKLLSNVRSANLMLQKGRLSVLQNKNQYDARGCIGALENCMLDDMVCGEGYLKCLDPTKRYIDENGDVVLGNDISQITAFMESYNNANINAEFIKTAMNDVNCANGDGACIVNYLMSKIGTGATVKDGGLCRAVLDKCQTFTYDVNGKTATYRPYNDIVVNYIQRAMVNIKAAQSKLISDYASTCLANVSDCYNQQVTQINSYTTTANANSIYNVMTGACYNVALTCGYAVFAYDDEVLAGGPTALIQGVSDLFYQSLLCPSNSTFSSTPNDVVSPNRTMGGWANTRCQCNSGYTVWGGACVPSCNSGDYRNTLGACVTCDGALTGGNLVMEHDTCSTGCPANSASVTGTHTVDVDRTKRGYVTSSCRCASGYTVWNGMCLETCSSDTYRTDEGVCSQCIIEGQTPTTPISGQEASSCERS